MKTVTFEIKMMTSSTVPWVEIENVYDKLEKIIQDSELTGDYEMKTIIE
jgi:hypothetical protein